MYQSMFQPTMPYNMFAQQPQVQAPKMEVDRVNGRNGAEMFRMAPDSSALLLDCNDSIIWFVQTDSAGYKTATPYDFFPHKEEKEPDAKTIEERLNGIDERLKTIEEALK